MIIAAGYSMEHFNAGNPPRPIQDFDKGPVTLSRIKYQVEYERYARKLKDREWDWVNPDAAPRWRNALETLRAASVHKVGDWGAFVSKPGSIFDQISLIDLRFRDDAIWESGAILARDRNTGRILGWTFRGTEIPLPIPPEIGLSAVGYHSTARYPFLARKDRIVFPDTFGRSLTRERFESNKWSAIHSQLGEVHFASSFARGLIATVEGPDRQLGVYKLNETITGDSTKTAISRDSYRLLFPKRQLSIECMTSGPEEDSLVIVSNTTRGRLVLYLPEWGHRGAGEPDAKQFNIPDGVLSSEVAACAASNEDWNKYLYVAIRNQGIRKFEIPAAFPGTDKRPRGEAPFWQNSKAAIFGTAGRTKNFTSLFASEKEKGWYVLYGVAADQSIYRFTADGVPEQRIDIDLPGTTKPRAR